MFSMHDDALLQPCIWLVGAVVGLSLIVIKGRDKNIPIPFGPYLASAGFLALLWEEQITGFYYGLIL